MIKFSIPAIIGMLVGIGMSASISSSLGKGRRDLAEKYLGKGFISIIIASILVAILGNIFITNILTLFGASENTMPFAIDYLRPLMIGTICNLCAFGLNLF